MKMLQIMDRDRLERRHHLAKLFCTHAVTDLVTRVEAGDLPKTVNLYAEHVCRFCGTIVSSNQYGYNVKRTFDP